MGKWHLVPVFMVSLLAFGTVEGLHAAPGGAPDRVTGRLFNAPFNPTQVEVNVLGRASIKNPGKAEHAETVHIHFRTGKDFFPDQEILLMMQLPQGTQISNLRWVQPPVEFGTEAYRKQFYPKGNNLAWGVVGAHYSRKQPGKSTPTTEMSRVVGASIAFGPVQNGRVSGHVDVRIDGGKAVLKGRFVATVKKP